MENNDVVKSENNNAPFSGLNIQNLFYNLIFKNGFPV